MHFLSASFLSRAGLCVIYAQWKAVNPVYAYQITAPGAVHTYYLVKQLQANDWPRVHKLKGLASRPKGVSPRHIKWSLHSASTSLVNNNKDQEQCEHGPLFCLSLMGVRDRQGRRTFRSGYGENKNDRALIKKEVTCTSKSPRGPWGFCNKDPSVQKMAL